MDLASNLCHKHERFGYNLNVSTTLDHMVVVKDVYCDCLIKTDSVEFIVDLILLPIQEFDVILGTDWLTKYLAVINYFTKEVVLEAPSQSSILSRVKGGGGGICKNERWDLGDV